MHQPPPARLAKRHQPGRKFCPPPAKPENSRQDRLRSRRKAARLDAFSARPPELDSLNPSEDYFQKPKNEPEKSQAAGANSNLLMGENMKSQRGCETRITREDYDSFFLWKVFWKLIKQENPFVFFGKVLLVGAFLIVFTLCLFLTGEFFRA